MTLRGFAIGVVGFGRCGSSMTMAMLEAGGVPAVAGATPVARESDLRTLTAGACLGHATKLLDLPWAFGDVDDLFDGPVDWRFVWLDRNPIQQAKSAVKLMRGVWKQNTPASAAKRFQDGFVRDREACRAWYARRGDVLDLRYEDVLRDPTGAAKQLADHVGAPFDVVAAAGVVHDRTPKCRPDLAFEFAEVRP